MIVLAKPRTDLCAECEIGRSASRLKSISHLLRKLASLSFKEIIIGQISILWHRPSGYSGLAVSLQFKASKQFKEVYIAFKDTFPSQKIGLSKFAELRPPHYAGASGSHSVCVCVCVCTIHRNVKLMFLGAKLYFVILGAISLPT